MEPNAIPNEINDHDWEHIFAEYSNGYKREDIASVIAASDGENDGASWVGVFKMKDGNYLYLTASCDYTGWGCQEGGNCATSRRLSTIKSMHCTQEDRRRLFP